MTQKCLDDSNINTALEQVGREAVAQCMQRHALADCGRIGRLMEQAVELAGLFAARLLNQRFDAERAQAL
jgi:hypothetical protein